LSEEITRRVKLVESAVIEFPVGGDLPIASDQAEFARVIDTLVEIEELAKKMSIAVSLTIYGHADPPGSPRRNYEISQSRARTVASMLYARGSSMPISIYGMGAAHPKEDRTEGRESARVPQSAPSIPRDDQASRRIEFRIHLSSPPAFDAERVLFQ
ncbi:MAG: OmpA family protein, partial [Candidatus Accumulibacter sp.]|nr:OmpA family protein [Accumulibacter sp.]